MRKVLIVLFLLLLCGCGTKREEFYRFGFEGEEIVVGYDKVDALIEKGFDIMTDSELEKGESCELEVYYNEAYAFSISVQNFTRKTKPLKEAVVIGLYYDLNDYPGEISIEGKTFTSLKEAESELSGTVYLHNGKALVLEKEVDGIDRVVLYGNLLNKDIDLIDHLEIRYIQK